MKPLVALYKAFRGGEWFGASLESIRPHCEGAVVVLSDQPWRSAGAAGGAAPENCYAPLGGFRRRHPDFPVTVIRPGVRQDTEEQYRLGLAAIGAMYGAGHGVLIVDTDEVWDGASLSALRGAMARDRRALYFRSGIYSYVRSPLYRVAPKEAGRPVVALANPGVPTGRSRFANMHELGSGVRVHDVPGCDMHHMGYVRLDPGEIAAKMEATSSQDGPPPRRDWKSAVWDELPGGSDIHPAVGFESCWRGVEEVPPGALPPSAADSDAFWATLAHHRGGAPAAVLLAGDPAWRAEAEASADGVETEVPGRFALCLSAELWAASGGRATQDDCIFLAPRLRMNFREVAQLAEHAAGVPEGGLALEIGSGMGGSMAVIGACAPPGTRLVAVDPFVPYDEENVTLSRGVEVGTPEDLFETARRFGLSVELLRLSSERARSGWQGGEIDLLLVDGNHSHGHAKYDISAWWPLVRPGGVLLVHDLSGRFPGVVRAAREFEAQSGLRFELPRASTLAWLRKPS